MRRARSLWGLVVVVVALVGCTPQPADPPAPRPCDSLLVGDSLLLYATQHVDLTGTFAAAGCPATVDAQVARSTSAAASVVEQVAASGTLPSGVGVTSAGWDAYTSSDQVGASVDRVMAVVGNRPVVWVNAFVLDGTDRDQIVNAVLAAKDAEYANLTVLDHYAWVDAHRDLLVDLAHLTTEGETLWTERLLAAVRLAAG